MGDKPPKYDPNTEIFQMRAQWKKAEICREQWHDKWSWLLDERKQTLAEANAIRQEAAQALTLAPAKTEFTKSLKPVPITSTGFIGWLATKPDCQLEIYTPWLDKPPLRLPDAWENPHYVQKNSSTEDDPKLKSSS